MAKCTNWINLLWKKNKSDLLFKNPDFSMKGKGKQLSDSGS